MNRPHFLPCPDATEPRDEDLDLAGRDDKGKWEPAKWWVMPALLVSLAAAVIVSGVAFGVFRAVSFWVYFGLTGDR